METLIVNYLKNDNQNAFGLLYEKYFGLVSKFVWMNSGSEADAEELFECTMAVLLYKLRKDEYHLTASVKTYILAIAKNLWYRKFWCAESESTYSDIYSEKNSEEINLFIEKESSVTEKVQFSLQRMSYSCRRLINSMFF